MKKDAPGKNGSELQIQITPPNLATVSLKIVGVAPLVMNKFSEKAKASMRRAQEAGSTGKKGKKKEAKDFHACYEAAKHKAKDGWDGIPAPAFRNAMISACRMVGFKMTHAKLSVFVLPDGFCSTDGTPLVKITKGEAHYHESHVRNETGVCDIRPRPMYDEGWEATVRVQFDQDQFTAQDVTNLLHRAGLQVGIGEGRPDSKKSGGIGWGLFTIKEG